MSDEEKGPVPVPPEGYVAPEDCASLSESPVEGLVPTLESMSDLTPSQPTWSQRVKWVFATFGIAVLFFAVQVAVMTVAMPVAAVMSGVSQASGPLTDTQAEALTDEALERVFDESSLEFQTIFVTSQIAGIAVMYPLWRRVRKRGFVPLRAYELSRVNMVKALGSLVVMGLGIQLAVGVALTIIGPLFPEAMAEHDALMARTAGVAAMVEAVSLSILAPLLEEVACRGLMLEFALRSVAPWSKKTGARGVDVPSREFWIANLLQASVFGIMHANLIQTTYAIAGGMLLGYVYWKTGRLRYPIMLHLGVNLSSYLISPFSDLLSAALPDVGILVVFAVVGVALIAASWHAFKGVFDFSE